MGETREDRMTSKITKISAAQKRLLLEVRRESAKMRIFRRIGLLGGLSGKRMGCLDGKKR